jgi:hypothetical protein
MLINVSLQWRVVRLPVATLLAANPHAHGWLSAWLQTSERYDAQTARIVRVAASEPLKFSEKEPAIREITRSPARPDQ